MFYKLEPLFLILPLLCLFFHLSDFRTSKRVGYALVFLFVLLYSFSLNGSDIEGYRWHYSIVADGAPAAANAQEIGYYLLMRLGVYLGLNYILFRVLLLSFLSTLLILSIAKFSDDLPLSLFFVSSMFVVYTISAYRQFIVISFSVMWFFVFCSGRKMIATIGTGFLILFHITAILPFGFMVLMLVNTEQRAGHLTDFIVSNYASIIILALILRVIVAYTMSSSMVRVLLERLLSNHSSPTPNLLTFGLLSRIVFLFCISYLFQLSNTSNYVIKLVFLYYFISIVLYIIVPLELVMGRLINNAYIFCSVLIPSLRREVFNNNHYYIYQINKHIVTLNLIILALIILVFQMLNQDGYTPYLNILLGDREVLDFSILAY